MNKLSLILVFITLLAAAAALNPPVLKKSLYLRDWGRTAYNIFRTKDSTISLSSDHSNYHQVDPTYRILGFTPSSVTEILRNTTEACDKNSYIDSRLVYYEKDDSLLYFCYNNKSLLVLDSDRYTVQRSIPLSFDFSVLEMAKLYLESDSLVILLINSGFRQGFLNNFNSTVFMRVNLTTQKVTQNFILSAGPGSTESVVAYAGNGTTSYILTNTWHELSKYVCIYAFNSSGNNYNILSSLYSETLNFKKTTINDIYSQLYVAGDLVMFSNNGSIIFFNQKGQVISKVENLTMNSVDFGGWRRNPAFFEGKDKTFYFESDSSITQFNVQGTSIKSKILVSGGSQLQIARGNSQQGDLVFYLEQKPMYDDSYWYVIEADTSKILSQMPRKYGNIFTTDDTYGILNNMTISIFGWNNDTLLKKIKIEQSGSINDEFYYYDTENSYFYYLRYPNTPNQCDLVQIDISTGASRSIYSLNEITLCTGRITQINSTTLDFVIEDKKGEYFVNSARFGKVEFFYIYEVLLKGFAVFDFNDLSVSLIHYPLPSLGWKHSFYTFDSRSKFFTLQNTTKVMGLDDLRLRVFRYLGGQKVFITTTWNFNSLDLTTNVVTAFGVHYRDSLPTKLVGNGGDEGFIVTDRQVYSGIPYYYNYNEATQFGSLPTEQELALDARASGRCKYFQNNGYSQSDNIINIYDFCGSSEKLTFVRKFLRSSIAA